MKVDNLEPVIRMIVRETALGLTPEDIVVNHPEYTIGQICKIQAGATFKRALADMNKQIDEELIAHAAEDPVRQYLRSSGLKLAKTLVRLADNEDEETPHSVQAKAAVDALKLGGYGEAENKATLPVIMLSTEKFNAVMNKPNPLVDVPDCVDGNNLPEIL